MKRTSKFLLVLVTAPDRKTARRLARSVLEPRLAACVNVIPAIESHYWWQGRLERGRELLLIIKTSRSRLQALERAVVKVHPYDTPEFIVTPLEGGNSRYLAWLEQSVKASQ